MGYTKKILIFSLILSLLYSVPTNINYQGYLSIGGLPYDGTTNISFEILNENSVSIWTENDVPLTVIDGVYSHSLRIPISYLDPTNTFYLHVSINGNDVSPDIPLMSVPYAYYARHVQWSNIQGIPPTFADDYDNTSSIWKEAPGYVFYTNTGNVGIGTASPQTDLEIEGADPAILLDDTAGAETLGFSIYNGGSAAVFSSPDGIGDIMALQLSNGRVGIGTPSPVAQLHVPGSFSDEIAAYIGNSARNWNTVDGPLAIGIRQPWYFGQVGTGANAQLTLHPELDNCGFYITSENDPYNYALGTWLNNIPTNITVTMVPGGGRVGIGTTTPDTLLHLSYNNNSISTPAIKIDTAGAQGLIEFQSTGTTTARIRADLNGHLVLSSFGTGDIYLKDNDSDVNMTILDNGNVGIGVTPTAKLHVVGSQITLHNANSSAMLHLIGGNYLDYDDYATIALQSGYGDWTYHEYSFIRSENTGGGGVSRSHLVFGVKINGGTTTEWMRLDNQGHLGIGTDDTGIDHLDVRGRAYASGGWQTVNADYAEWFVKEGDASPGDLIGMNPQTGKVRKYKNGDEFIGIYSTDPAYVGNRLKETEEELKQTHLLVGLLGQLDFKKEQTLIKGRTVNTKDGKKIGVLLSNGKLFIR